MPVRSSSSAIVKWPDADTVGRAVRRWADDLGRKATGVVAVGYFGSYARGDWGVGSDVDVVVILEHAAESFERRAARWDATRLPVPADVLVYTRAEWVGLAAPPRYIVWVLGSPRGSHTIAAP